MSSIRKLPNFVPHIEKFGDWDRTRRLLAGIDKVVLAGSIAGKLSAAKELKRIVRRNIRNNGGSIGWAPPSPRYAKLKSKLGGDPGNLLVLSGTYYRNIDVWQTGDDIHVGVKKGIRNKLTGNSLTVGQIARILEYGSDIKNIPARPLWGPSYKQFGGGKRVKGFILWHIRNKIFLAYGIRPKITI